jgi:ribonuclease D
MNTSRYKEEFSNYISIMKEALDRENFAAYNAAKDMLDESVGECKHEKELESQLNTSNFGVLNHIFEERLPELFKANKKAVRDVIKLIKEDKNLSAQFDFYENIRNYKGKISEMVDPVQFLSQFNAVVEKHNLIDKDTIIESNKKLRKVLKENNVVPTEFISEEAMNLYNAGHNLLTKKQTLKNVAMISESIDSVKNYMNKHKGDKVNESVDPHQLIADFENKLKETLTESEMAFVQEITDWRSPIAEQRKEKLFNKFKNECIDKINEMLSEDTGNVELESLKKQIEEQKFNKESIVKDIAKLLEIRDILLDK